VTALRLSVLDFPRRLADSIELARWAEECGYHRFWLAEHAPQPNPILMASLVAARTRSIRVGTAGILFHSYSPARVAYDFQLLEEQYPGRIDAGFCGGWFPEALVEHYLDGRPRTCKTDAAAYERRVQILVRTLRGVGTEDTGAGADDRATPRWAYAPPTRPQIWCMGTGSRSAGLAALHRISFAYSLFHRASRAATHHVEEYRAQLAEARATTDGECVIAAAIACGRDDAHARSIAEQSDLSAIVPTVVGDARRCADELRVLAERYGTSEIVLLELSGEVADRAQSFARLANALT
jgi:luciferase family oxidoreductase group 1